MGHQIVVARGGVVEEGYIVVARGRRYERLRIRPVFQTGVRQHNILHGLNDGSIVCIMSYGPERGILVARGRGCERLRIRPADQQTGKVKFVSRSANWECKICTRKGLYNTYIDHTINDCIMDCRTPIRTPPRCSCKGVPSISKPEM